MQPTERLRPAELRRARRVVVREAAKERAVSFYVEKNLPLEKAERHVALGVYDLQAHIQERTGRRLPESTLNEDIHYWFGDAVGQLPGQGFKSPFGANCYDLVESRANKESDGFFIRRLLQAVHKSLSTSKYSLPSSSLLVPKVIDAKLTGMLDWAIQHALNAEKGRHGVGWRLACFCRDLELDFTRAEEAMQTYQQEVTHLKPSPYSWKKALSALRSAYNQAPQPWAER